MSSANDHQSSWYIQDPNYPPWVPALGFLGAAFSIVFSSLGAAIGTAKSMEGLARVAYDRPQIIMKAIVPVVMAGVIAIYGLVVSVVIAQGIHDNTNTNSYSLLAGFVHLGAGLTMGLSGFASGYSIGVVSESGIPSAAYQPKGYTMFVGTVGFAMVIGIYGLITAIIFNTRVTG